jgi:heme oxygenase (biliverdin-IX-beta and delta-forming)
MNQRPDETKDPAAACRGLIRRSATAVLATIERDPVGWPYASLVQIAAAHDGSPILLLSNLAEHTKNFVQDGRVSLLFDGTGGLDNPLTGARATLQGRIRALGDDEPEVRMKRRYLARHPDAVDYAAFADFKFYTIEPERLHLVAGFGRINWLPAGTVLLDAARTGTLAEEEESILAHMNADHADAVDLYAHAAEPNTAPGWRMAGIDPEGADLRREGRETRLAFADFVTDGASARRELVRLVKVLRYSTGTN